MPTIPQSSDDGKLADNLVIEGILITPHGKSHGFSFFVTKQRHNPNRLD